MILVPMPPTLGVSAEAVGKCLSTLTKQIRMISCMWLASCCLSQPIVCSNLWSNKDAAEKNYIEFVILTQLRECNFPLPRRASLKPVAETLLTVHFLYISFLTGRRICLPEIYLFFQPFHKSSYTAWAWCVMWCGMYRSRSGIIT